MNSSIPSSFSPSFPTKTITETSPSTLSLLPLCTTFRDLTQMHAHLIKTTEINDPYSSARLAEFYTKHGNLTYATKILNSVSNPNHPFIYNVVMRGHLKNISQENPGFEIFKIFNQMLMQNVRPDHHTFTILLKGCGFLSDMWGLGKMLHCVVIKNGFLEMSSFIRNALVNFYAVTGLVSDARKVVDSSFEVDIVGWNSLLKGYANEGNEGLLRELFGKMVERDIVSWNTIIGFYVDVGEYGNAMGMFKLMQEDGVCRPDRVTLISVMTASAHLGALAQGRWVHAYINKNGIELDENLGSALVNMYGKCGCLDGMFEVFRESRKIVDTWNAMIGGLAWNGQSLKSIEMFTEMEMLGVLPDKITFSCVLNACSHGGLVEDGVKYFEKMVNSCGIEPDIGHYGCMVDLFGRAGLFDRAEEIIESMPMKPDEVMWKALLNASKIHGNLEVGEKAAHRLMELSPDDHENYVMLSNLYALNKKWDGVSRIRKTMSDRGISKIPGCSMIDVHGVVHEFIAGDKNHPQKNMIYKMLEEMGKRLKEKGCKHDTEQVLLDIDDEEVKQTSLNHHSERLAVAFGFISTKPRTTIRVVKNLRICSDCHSVMKHLSEIYNRDIVVRDSNRHHHFKEGTCSCMDYW